MIKFFDFLFLLTRLDRKILAADKRLTEAVLPSVCRDEQIESPPQTCSMKFNDKGQVEVYTIGYVMDRSVGNTGGLGGVFGLFYATGNGLPFREAMPWTPSFRYRLFQNLQKFAQFFGSQNK